MRRAGLRALTVWDNANGDLRDSYEKNCRYLYGATVQDFGAGDAAGLKVEGGVTNGRLWFAKHETHYEGRLPVVLADMTEKIEAWDRDKKEPLFLSYQVQTWQFHTPQLVELYEEINKKFGGSVEFVRADHFFALHNEANGLPFNLCMNAKTRVTVNGDSTVFDFGGVYKIHGLLSGSESEFEFELSENGTDWQGTAAGGFMNARYARVNSAAEEAAGLEIYGCVIK
jgi:hypothetical protein